MVGGGEGITGSINTIGIAGGNPDIRQTTANVLISTDQQLFEYDSDEDQLIPSHYLYTGTYKLYQTDYREEMLEDSTSYSYIPTMPDDTVRFQPVAYYQAESIIDDVWLWEGGSAFGKNIATADYIMSDLVGDSYSTNLFWGDSKGLSQNFAFGSGFTYSPSPSGHYLNNINVNKIGDIYGLTTFALSLQHQHLLIGTDSGFYYSSNIMQQNTVTLRTFSLYKDSDVGSVGINDISVNAVTTDQPVCENGVWLAANDGLYLLKPDYSASFNPQTIQAINSSFKNYGHNVKPS